MKKNFFQRTVLIAALIALPVALVVFSPVLAKAQNQEQNRVRNNATTTPGNGNATTTPNQKITGLENAEMRRSEVANAVKEMLSVADRSGGIGQQVRTIAQEQEKNFESAEASLEKAQNRNKFIRFLLGADYKEIKKAKDLLGENENKIQELNRLRNQIQDPDDQAAMETHLKNLEQIRDQVQLKLDEAQKGFSLFGWLSRLFN